MPPNIIDIIITAIGEYLDPWVDIVITATGDWAGALDPFIDIVLTAIPRLGGVPAIMFMAGAFLVLVMGWETITGRGW